MRRKLVRKKTYQVDGKNYSSKALYDCHLKLKKAKAQGIIKSFALDGKKNIRSKYSTYKPVIDGIKFDSLMEGNYYVDLKTKEYNEGTITDIQLQPEFILQQGFSKNGKKYRPIMYIADFLYKDTKDKSFHLVDVKGKETVDFKLKRKIFEYKFPEYNLEVLQFHEASQSWMDIDQLKKLKRKAKKNKTSS